MEPELHAIGPELEPPAEDTRFALGKKPQAVVVGGSAPELEPGTVEEGATAIPAQLSEQASLSVDHGPHVLRLEHDSAAAVRWPHTAPVRRPTGRTPERGVRPSDFMARWSPQRRPAEREAE